MTDEITLTIPRERPFSGIVDLVFAGLGARHDLTIEAIDDIQLALENLLDRDDEGQVTVRMRLVDGVLEAEVGPFERDALDAELASELGVGLGRLLSAVVDDVKVSDAEDGTWVGLRKELPPGGVQKGES